MNVLFMCDQKLTKVRVREGSPVEVQWARTCSFGWCLAEGYRNGDQHRRMDVCGSGKEFSFQLLDV